MDMLETGVVLCQLAKELQERMIFASNGKVLTPKFISYHTYCNFFTLIYSSINYRATVILSLAGPRLML